MTHQEMLDAEIAQHGRLEDCPWTSFISDKTTLGQMTDNHVHNCIQYHQGLAMMAEVTPGMENLLVAARYIVFKMQTLKESRT